MTTDTEPPVGLGQVLQDTRTLVATLQRSPDDHRAACARLTDSVLRPLSTIVSLTPADDTDGHTPERRPVGQLDASVWELARSVTTLYAAQSTSAELGEAVAALQDLAIALTDDAQGTERLADLQTLQAGLSPRIQCAHNGPYVVTNVSRVVD